MRRILVLVLLSLVGLSLASCSGKNNSVVAPPVSTGGADDGGAAGIAGMNFLSNFPAEEVFSGGVPRDGIPALTDPRFVNLTSSEADYLSDDDLVVGVVINGEAKAYPHNIGWWHEIINDVVGGQPVVVSLCPLTSTGMVYNGQGVGGERIQCGVSGLLFINNLIMYDRRDGDTLYPQMLGAGISGQRSGGKLELLPVIETTWRYWKRLYPNSRVISSNTGIYSPQSYFSNRYPYGNYRSVNTPPLFNISSSLIENAPNRGFATKDMILGIRFGEDAKAYPFVSMDDQAVINDRVAGNPIVVTFFRDEQFAIPFSRTVNNQDLTFQKIVSTNPLYPFLMRDDETGSIWNLKGEAVSGALQGQKLGMIAAHNAFWFAWASFWQDTQIF